MESHSIAGLEQKRLRARAIVRLHTCPTDQMPATRCLARINSGLASGNRYRSRGHAQSRGGTPGQREPLVDTGHVRKTGNEADDIDSICASGVNRNHLGLAESCACCDVSKVRPERTAITDVDVDLRTGRLSDVGKIRRQPAKLCLKIVSVDTKRIEINGDRTIPDDHITDCRVEVSCFAGKRHGTSADRGIDSS